MTTDTAAIETPVQAVSSRRGLVRVTGLLCGCLLLLSGRTAADPVLGPWVPIFQGIEQLSATNDTRSTDFSNLMVTYALRVDLREPGIQLLPSPRIENYTVNSRETAGMTVSRYVKNKGVQVAINAGFFRPGEYYLPEGTPMAVSGLLISQGESVSPANASYSASLLVDSANNARILATNWPAANTDGIQSAVSGDYPVLVDGVNIGRKYLGQGGIHSIHPRTAIGLSQDRRFLYLVVIDGRQPGYSDGAYDYETAAWLQLMGAHDAINMDGGGSTTMSIQDVTGNPRRLNSSSAVADSGRERTVGGHLGVFARPLEGFIHTMVTRPDDDAASITWRTQQPATTQVEYGTTADMGQVTPLDNTLRTEHAVRLTGLQPGTGYYFRAVSSEGGTRHLSADLYFTTLSFQTTNEVISLTNAWKHSLSSQDNTPWTTPTFDDTAWGGPGPALLWTDVRATGPNPEVLFRGTELPFDPETFLPYITYYFRTHFNVPEKAAGVTLNFSGFVDDGAVVHLNGSEIHRLRMEDPPAPILNQSLAVGYPCDGDATCLDEFTVGAPAADALVAGDNVLAVEVHNYNPNSADMTFGLSLVLSQSVSVPAHLSIVPGDPTPTLAWSRGGFVLQQAEAPEGPWTETPGPVILGPYRVPASATPRFYRLVK